MKYVSPIYEVEATSTEDIMSTSFVAKQMGIKFSGDTEKINNSVKIELTDSEGSSDGVDQNPETTTASGVSISMDFGGLFNN